MQVLHTFRVFFSLAGAAGLSRLIPRSLRAQFAVALLAMGLLIVAGGATAVYALYSTSNAARQFSEERLGRMQNAHDLQQRTQQIQLLADRMVSARSPLVAHHTYSQILSELDALEQLTARLAIGDDVSVLDLHQASQLFRNSVHIIAQLRETEVVSSTALATRTSALEIQREEMQTYAQAMTSSAREQSERLTREYQAAVRRIVDASHVSANWVVAWLAFSLLAAWFIARNFLGQHVIARLQQVSLRLRADDEQNDSQPHVPVEGNDEIGAMARAVEQFMSDRRQLAMTRARLEEEQQRLTAIIDNTADSIIVLQAGKVSQLNHAAESMFGLRNPQAVGQPGDMLMPDLDWNPGKVPGITRDAIARRSDGSTIPVEVSLNLVAAADGDLIVLVVRDATLRKEAERHLIAARDAAESARATQAALLANMSHELRTPLNAVLGYAQILSQDRLLTERQLRGVGIIRTSGEHLLALINDLLDLAKHEAGKLELWTSEVELAECLRITSDIIRVKALEAGLAFFVDVAPNVPTRVVVDEQRLRQVLLNLLSNAVKFTDRGEVVLRVRVVHTGMQRARLRFDVRDTGVGLREDQLENIFRPFEQVGDARHRTIGSGLGLAISRQLVRLMGGDIHVSSKPGQGTVFSFELDLQIVPTPVASSLLQRNLVGYEGPRKRILIVDDMAENRLRLRDMLRPLGFEIDEAGDPEQALERGMSCSPDLIVMDLEMPGMDSTQTMERIRETAAPRGIRIIAVSATAEADAKRIGQGLEVDVLLAKPLDRERLLREISAQLGFTWIVASTPIAQPL